MSAACCVLGHPQLSLTHTLYGCKVLTMSTKNTKRLSVNLPASSFEKLVGVAEDTQHTLSEVVRQALGLIVLAGREKKRGHVLYTGTKEGEILKELVILE